MLPAVCALVLYLPALRYGLVWDDTIFLRDLPLYRQIGAWFSAFTQPFVLSPNYYRPLPVLTFMAELRLGGLNPALFHLTNLALHAANTFLVACLAFTLARERQDESTSHRLAAAAGLLYGLHPALMEGAVFISGRFDLLVTLFLLLALLADARLAGKARPALVGLAFFLAGLSKEMAVSFLLALPLWQAARRWQPGAPLTLGTIVSTARQQGDAAVTGATLLAALAAAGVRWAALGYLLRAGTGRAIPVGTLLEHFLLIGRSLAEYLKLIFWPFTSLAPLHHSQLPLPAAALAGWVSWAALALALWGSIWLVRRRRRSGLLALAAFLALLPVSNIAPLELGGGAFVAERFLQFPLAVAVLAAAALWEDGAPIHRPRLAAVGVTWLLLSAATIQLVAPNWRDDISLWQWAAGRAPRSAMPFTNLSLQYHDRGDFQTGLALAEQALQRDPNDAHAWNNAGLALFGLERYAEAQDAFAKAIELQPQDPLFWNNLAGALREQGELGEAERILLDKVLSLNPELPYAHLSLGIVYLRAGRSDLATLALREALRLAPPEMRAEIEALLRQAGG